LTLAKLEATDDVSRESNPARVRLAPYNLDTAINLNGGALAMLIESPSHAASPGIRDGKPFPSTTDEILDGQLIAHQEAMRYLVETGGRSRWTTR
jgi:hypothetical protein